MHTVLFGITALSSPAVLSSANAADDSYADIPLAQVPRAVAQAVMKKFPDAQPQSASKGIEDNKPFYDVFIKVKAQKIWVTCDERGAILDDRPGNHGQRPSQAGRRRFAKEISQSRDSHWSTKSRKAALPPTTLRSRSTRSR